MESHFKKIIKSEASLASSSRGLISLACELESGLLTFESMRFLSALNRRLQGTVPTGIERMMMIYINDIDKKLRETLGSQFCEPN